MDRQRHRGLSPGDAGVTGSCCGAAGRDVVGGYSWTGRGHLDADVDRVAEVLLAVRPGRVGPDNAVLLDTAFWSRLELLGGPAMSIGTTAPRVAVTAPAGPAGGAGTSAVATAGAMDSGRRPRRGSPTATV